MKKLAIYICLIVITFILVSCNNGEKLEQKGSITLNFHELSITSESTSSSVLFATLEDISGEIVWSSSDPSIATITADQNSLVARLKGLSPGTVIIKASIGDIYDECRVTVTLGEYLTVSKPQIRLEVGKTEVIIANAHTDLITYSSSNPEFASVSESGLVTAISEGTSVITVKAGSKTVYVTVLVELAGFDVDKKDDIVLQMENNSSVTLTIIAKGGIDISNLTYSVDDSDIILVTRDNDKFLIEALETGVGQTTTIRFNLEGYPEISREITVKDVDLLLTLTPLTGTLLFNEDSFKLNATLTPEQSGDRAKIKWESSPSDIVIISDEGLITRNPNYNYLQDEVLVSITAKSVIDPEAFKTASIMVENPKKGIKVITDLESFNQIMTSSNNNADIYLEADIDLGGKIYNQPIMNADFNGTFYGNGHTISNFEGPGVFGSIAGSVLNLGIEGTITNTDNRGLLAFHINPGAVVKNIFMEVIFKDPAPYTAGLSLVGNGDISNIIMIINNPNNIPIDQAYADFVQGGQASNLIVYVKTGNVGIKINGARKTEGQMKQSSTFDNFDNQYWNIQDGEIPSLIIINTEIE